MSYFTHLRLFQKTATAIFIFFSGMMLLVMVTAYSRRSGSTGMDTGKIQKIRYDESLKISDEAAKSKL